MLSAEQMFKELDFTKTVFDDRIVYIHKYSGDWMDDDDKDYVEQIQFFTTGGWFSQYSYNREIQMYRDGIRVGECTTEPICVKLHKAINKQVDELIGG